METREWTFPEVKAKLESNGPWQDEPDKKQWTDQATGLPCLIVRGPVGALCGYVGVSSSHKFFEKNYDNLDVSVHGGLTYADFCTDDPDSICHLVEPGEDDHIWWFGFDCAHAWDYTPKAIYTYHGPNDIYWDFAYVTAECEKLAAQLAAL